MNADPGTVIGITGALLALFSLAYTRSQATAQRAQVDEMRRQTEETRRAQHFQTSHDLMRDAMHARHVWIEHFKPDWLPPQAAEEMTALLEMVGDLKGFSCLRMYIEQLQEMYFARKSDLVADDHWIAMHSIMHGFFGPEPQRRLFQIYARLGMMTSEFAQFGNEFAETGLWKDPLGRLAPQTRLGPKA